MPSFIITESALTMYQCKNVYLRYLTLVLVCLMTLMMIWNNPVYNTYIVNRVVTKKTSENLLLMRDFYKVPQRDIYIYKQPALFVNTKDIFIFSLGYVLRRKYEPDMICLQKLDNGEIVKSGVNIRPLHTTREAKAFKYHSVFIDCHRLSNSDMPVQISIVPMDEQEVDQIWMDVIDRRNHTVPAKNGIAMCVNTIYNHRSPRAVIEWVEVQRLMEVDKIYLYGYRNVSKSVEEVLHYYQELGVVHIQPFNHGWPRFHETFSRRRYDLRTSKKHHNLDLIEDTHNQFAAYNDCLYRFGSLHKYLVYIDLDEFIVASNLTQIQTYADIIAPRERYGALYFSQVRFCVPGWMHLEHSNSSTVLITGKYTLRTPPLRGVQLKLIVKPSEIRSMGVHRPHAWWGKARQYGYPVSEAKKHHYKHKMYNMIRGQEKCLKQDNSMVPFQIPLMNNVQTTVEHMNL